MASSAAVQLNIQAESETGVAEDAAEPALPESSDQLLVAALKAVGRLRDTVDRIVVFSQLRQMLEHEAHVLDQTVANDQVALKKLIIERQAGLNELRSRRECLLRTLHLAEGDFSPKRPSASSS